MSRIITIDLSKQKNLELAQTAEGMCSTDYKERFIAEYVQLKNRLNGLKKMLSDWDNPGAELTFIPTCPRELYDYQVKAMEDYLNILKIRAKIEGLKL